jgi:hypothetical protein
MSLQVHAWRATTSFSASATNFITPLSGQVFTATEVNGSCPCAAAGTFSFWQVVLPAAPGAGKSVTFTLRINGGDTGAAITIADTATVGTYTGAAIALADGDIITIKSVPSGTPTASAPTMSWAFNSTTPNESIYGAGGVNGTIASGPRTNTVLFRPDTSNFQTLVQEVVACPGTLTKAIIALNVDVGASGSMTFVINKNGVAQDGSGGTPDTRIVFDNTGTTKSATFSLALVAGDQLSWTATETGSAASIKPTTGVRFVSTNPGESNYGGVATQSLDAVSTNYLPAGNGTNAALPTAEANAQVNVGLVGFKLKNLYTMTSSNNNVGEGWDWSLKKNGSATSLATQQTGATVAANDTTGSVTYQPQDAVAMEVTPVLSPIVRFSTWSAVQSQVGNAPSGKGNTGRKGGGGGVSVQNTGGASFLQQGNLNLDVSIGG